MSVSYQKEEGAKEDRLRVIKNKCTLSHYDTCLKFSELDRYTFFRMLFMLIFFHYFDTLILNSFKTIKFSGERVQIPFEASAKKASNVSVAVYNY